MKSVNFNKEGTKKTEQNYSRLEAKRFERNIDIKKHLPLKKRLELYEQKILTYGNNIFTLDPKTCEKIIELGYKAAPLLNKLMAITDPKMELHIPSTAVGLARKIIQKNDEQTIRYFAQEFKNPFAPVDHIFHVLKDCPHPIVMDTMRSIYSSISTKAKTTTNLTPQEISMLRYSTIYLARNGSIFDAFNILELLDVKSEQIRVLAGVNLINFSLREDIKKEDKKALAKEIISNLAKNNNFYASKLEILEKGGFIKEGVLEEVFSEKEYFNPIKMYKTLYYSILERFFRFSDNIKERLKELLLSKTDSPQEIEKIKIATNILFSNLKNGVVLSPKDYNQFFELLEPLANNEKLDIEIRKKIALILSFFPSQEVKTWMENIYELSKTKTDEFIEFVFSLTQRPDAAKEELNPIILIVDSDNTFANVLKTEIKYYLSQKDLKFDVIAVDSAIEANAYLMSARQVRLCFLSEKIELTPQLLGTYKKSKSAEAVLHTASRMHLPPTVVYYYSSGGKENMELLKRTYSSLLIRECPKIQLLKRAREFLKHESLSRSNVENQKEISIKIMDYLNHPKIRKIMENEYNIEIKPTEQDPLGQEILILHRDIYAHIQLKQEPEDKRIRFLLIMPSVQTPLLDRSGLKKVQLEHIGGFNINSDRISPAYNSLKIYADVGGDSKTGIIKYLEIADDKGNKIDSFSKGDELILFDENNRFGAISGFINKSPRPILLKLIEYP